MGFDVHRLVEGRELWLGGVKIDYEKGLLGHSDADVLLHAVSDALLGAAGLGERVRQALGKDLPILTGRLLKIQHRAGVAPASAFPQHRAAEGIRVPDGGRLPVTDGQQPAPGLQQQILPQQGGPRSDAVRHMSQCPFIFGRGLGLVRCDGKKQAQMSLPLVQAGVGWYTALVKSMQMRSRLCHFH